MAHDRARQQVKYMKLAMCSAMYAEKEQCKPAQRFQARPYPLIYRTQ